MANDSMKLIYSFEGHIDTAILKKILEDLKQIFTSLGKEKLFVKKVNSMVIECLQNVIYYANQENDSNRLPKFELFEKETEVENDDCYTIISSNLIPTDKTQGLGSYLNKINGMNKEEQRDFYQKVLANGQFNEQGGAGLGFVNMARKTRTNKVGYQFEPVNDQFSYFTLFLEV